MKKRMIDRVLSVGLAMVMMVALPFTSLASGGVNEGRFTDYNNLTWTTWDGVSTTYGRGPKFSEVHPDVTDPEYFLKETHLLDEDSSYSPEVVAEIRKFVNSFDWINSDELTRANMVHDRIANNSNGNTYEHSSEDYTVLMTGKGTCGDFSGEFKNLARYVGLECEVYTPSYLHQACLIKISGQWFATDPTAGQGEGLFLSNATTYPVDYETEYYRWEKESKAEREASYAENPDSLVTIIALTNQKTSEGTITEEDWARINPIETELDRKLLSKEISYEEYERQMIELLKSMW